MLKFKKLEGSICLVCKNIKSIAIRRLRMTAMARLEASILEDLLHTLKMCACNLEMAYEKTLNTSFGSVSEEVFQICDSLTYEIEE